MSGPIRSALGRSRSACTTPARPLLHRASAGFKLGLLAVFAVAVVVIRGPVSAVVFLGVALLAQLVARLPWRRTTRGLVPALVDRRV